MKETMIVAIGCLAGVVMNGCSGGPSTPGAPSSAPAVVSIAVSGGPASSGPYQVTTGTFQLTANAHLSDGTMRDVTSAAQWASSNGSLATISSTGLVSVVASGQVEFHATYQTVTGSLSLFVGQPPPPKFTLSGIAREPGTDVRPLSGVRVLITAGPDAGASAVSDQSGLFTFNLSPGVVKLEGTKDGYLPNGVSNLTISHDMTIDFALYPIPPRDANGVTATARCKDRSWSWERKWDAACTQGGGVLYPVCPGPLC